MPTNSKGESCNLSFVAIVSMVPTHRGSSSRGSPCRITTNGDGLLIELEKHRRILVPTYACSYDDRRDEESDTET
jgi:hypothetical protein